MRLTETAEQHQLREMIGGLLDHNWSTAGVRSAKYVCEEVADRPAGASAPVQALWRALADNGLFGLAIGERWGGQGAGLGELGILFGECGRRLCPTTIYSTLLLGLAIDRWGSDDHRRRYLPRIAAGELAGTVSCWNPSDAADVQPSLRADRVAGRWVLCGTADFVPGADRVDLMLVTAAVAAGASGPGDPAPTRTLAVLIPPDTPGISTEAIRTIASDPLFRVTFDGVGVDDDAVLAEPDSQAIGVLARTAVALQCSEMVGGTEAVLDRTVAYVAQREQFGRPIGSFQAVQHQIADVRIAVDGARLAAASAVWWLGEGEPAVRETAIAALLCSETYQRATLTAHQLHGGMGYVRETDLHLWSERAAVTAVAGGSADDAARVLADEIGLGR